jgi:hypothetical protein
LRLESELERELEAAELICGKAYVAREPPPPACRAYVAFLKRVREWLRCGVAPRHARRDTRQLMHAIGSALAARGQADLAAVRAVEPRPPRRRDR